MKTLKPLLWILLVTSSCKKDCHEKGNCPPEYYFFKLDSVKDYLYAGKGSYWIYKNSKTGDLDTQTCTSNSINIQHTQGIFDYSKHISIDYEQLRKTTYSSFNNYYHTDETFGVSAEQPDYKDFKVYLKRTTSGIGQLNIFHNPFEVNKWKGTLCCISINSNFNMQGKYYKNVIVFQSKSSADEPNLHCYLSLNTYYWVRGIGIIKKELEACGYSWELIEYKIIN